MLLESPKSGRARKKSLHDLSGRKVGWWKVHGESGLDKHSKRLWKCECRCGAIRNIATTPLVRGVTLSCGCAKTGVSADDARPRVNHGLAGTGVCVAWAGIIRRCLNKKCRNYSNYGGRGIKICSGIAATPQAIVDSIGHRPKFKRRRHYSIDRIDNSGHYSCGECPDCIKRGWPLNIRWTTQRVQTRNFRRNRMITIDGITKCMADWAESTGVIVQTISGRRMRGYRGRALISQTPLPNR